MSSPTNDPTPTEPPESPATPAGATNRVAAALRPASNAGWAVTSLIFFWPLAFSAFTHAFNVYPLWASGDVAGAQDASDRVRRLGQISLWIFGGLLLLFLVLYAIGAIVLLANGDDGGIRGRHWG
ncbi:CD225/dispanin family protein [Rhodococcus marinonascens]|uniref:CD225/dispanin family protein n=1 Tax=Rhodococcus marinonascens TaxID=38311 RepID=UPI0009347D50|nr:CD225/dispanin family protein [Rhodococcus marinonascens]